MSLSIQFLGAQDGGDGPFHLASATGWATFSRWVAEAASLGSPLPLLSALTNDGECRDTAALGDEIQFALKDHPPVEEPAAWDIAKVLLEAVGVGDRDEMARVVDGDEEDDATSNSNPEGCNQWKKCEGREDGSSYFDEKALKTAEEQNYKSREKLIHMPIKDFLKLAEHIDEPSRSKTATVASVLKGGKKFSDIPHLGFEHDGEGNATVVSHEGRHRAMALEKLGVTHIPVKLISQGTSKGGSIRWGSQDSEYDKLKGEWPSKLYGESGGTVKFPIADLRE